MPSTASPRSPRLHVALWVVQGLLALAFLGAGAMKLTAPMEELVANMPWVSGAMGRFVRLIGACEVAGALGLVLPAATRIRPVLTPLAAAGLATVMLLAAITHLARGEAPFVVVNAVLGGLASFVAWGRLRAAPVAGR